MRSLVNGKSYRWPSPYYGYSKKYESGLRRSFYSRRTLRFALSAALDAFERQTDSNVCMTGLLPGFTCPRGGIGCPLQHDVIKS